MDVGERFNGYSHLAGLVLAVAGAVLLMERALLRGDAATTAGVLVFTLCSIALYAASTLCHACRGAARVFWQRADHCAIYLLIAGSFSPFALAALQGAWRWGLLAALWSLAAWGIARELRPAVVARPSAGIYLAMGWLCVLAAVPLALHLGGAVLAWLLAGALAYSAGTVFYRNRRGWRHAHGTWHLFVLGGTASHYMAVRALVPA